jgi:hypothetical protein
MPQWPMANGQWAACKTTDGRWNGRVGMLPDLAADVHDSYIAGVGTLHAARSGLLTVADVPWTTDSPTPRWWTAVST